jgi:hypothetical protein
MSTTVRDITATSMRTVSMGITITAIITRVARWSIPMRRIIRCTPTIQSITNTIWGS